MDAYQINLTTLTILTTLTVWSQVFFECAC